MKLWNFGAVALLTATLATQIHAEEDMDQTAILETISAMTTAFAAGNIDGVMATYEPSAVVIAQPGQPVAGDAALRAMFAEFVASGVNFAYGAHEVVVAGDTGLHLMSCTAPGPDGPMTSLSVAVLHRQPDGSWKIVIDHPFGDAVMDQE
ncbi:nuclear transport factor 2 family protein [Rhizobium sp. AAP116]|uniref:YybH family protein n=1 Tax=Rhizobium sp. AAP116 TaxID=1523429 RepID=UPI0006B96E2F|nr:nuclear transport factor 2 family protein [Rhizobium sp. AAP116]